MAGIGAITLDAAGSVTAPSSLPLTLPSAESTRVNQHALKSMALMPAERGVMWADGIDPLRHYVTSVLGTGLLAPSTAPTATPTGTRATSMLDLLQGGAFTVADGDYLQLVNVGWWIVAKTSFSATPSYDEVYCGSPASNDTFLTNLKKFINGTGVEGTDYVYVTGSNGFANYITAETLSTVNDQLTFQAKGYGTGGNAYKSNWLGAAGPVFRDAGDTTTQTLFSGGAAGSGTAPGAGTYQYAYAFVREDDGAVSGLSPTVETSTAEAMNIAIAAMTASADATVDYNRYYRTTAGGGRFYRVDEVAAATTTATDSFSDDTITNFGAVAYDERLSRSYRAGLPPKGRYLATYRGRYFTGGALLSAVYQSGTASVTNASASVTISAGSFPRTSMIGREFKVASVSESYRIMAVAEATRVITLDRVYEGSTDATATYTIKDDRDPYELFWSEPGLPNNWPVVNSLKGVYSKDGKGITGLYSAFESLIIFTRQAVWRLTGYDNTSFQLQLVTDKCGCVSGHTVVMDGERLYWLGQDGVYGWAGSGDPVRISSPQSPDGDARGIDDTMSRLSLAYAHRATALYDEYDKEIRFHVPLDGEPTNRYSLVLSLQTGTWSLDTCEDYTWECIIQGPDGEDVSVAGDAFGCIWQTAISNSDGAYGFEPVQSISSATVRTATVSGTPFPTASEGLAGCPVWQVTSGGVWARNRVASNTSSVLTYCRFQTAQAAATQMAVGGILLWLQTGRFDLGERRLKKILPGMTVAHSPDSDGQYFFFFASDQGDFAIPTRGWTAGDLTETKARRRFIVAKDAMLHGWGLCAVEPGCDPAFAAVTIEARARQDLDL